MKLSGGIREIRFGTTTALDFILKHLSLALGMFSVLFPVSLSRLRSTSRSRHEFSAGESIKSGRNHNSAKRFTSDMKETRTRNAKTEEFPLYYITISKLTIPFLCPHKILSSSYAMFVLLYPLYYLYLTNCNTLVRNNKRSLPLLLYLIVSFMLKHEHVKLMKPQLHYWRREKEASRRRKIDFD